MKRLVILLLAALMLVSLCACTAQQGGSAQQSGSFGAKPQQQSGGGQPTQGEEQAPAYSGSYHRVKITTDNWADYFELKEIPLFTVSQGEVIAQVCQYYCVVLREEYLPYLKPGSSASVQFEVLFDLYIDTMDIDTNEGVYRHTDDLFYAVQTSKKAVFDRYALPASAYGADASGYAGFSNAFFTGYCALHAESKVWSGFYIDLSQAQVLSASGELELGG